MPTQGDVHARKQRVLVVDDDCTFLTLMIDILQDKWPDVCVTGANSCRDARGVFLSMPIDVAVLDLRMPNFEDKYAIADAGLELLQWIQKLNFSSHSGLFQH